MYGFSSQTTNKYVKLHIKRKIAIKYHNKNNNANNNKIIVLYYYSMIMIVSTLN